MIAANKCRVDGCDRNAAASMIRDTLPGPLPLCATHTEDFRMNGAGWEIVWDASAPEPTSVKTSAAASVGHSGPRAVETTATPDGTGLRLRSRLLPRRKKSA